MGRVGAGLIRLIGLIGPIGLIAVIVKVGEGYIGRTRGQSVEGYGYGIGRTRGRSVEG